MSRYTADSRDRVRDAVDMLALVELEGRADAARRTTATSAAVPSTTSARASFHVRPDEKHYHCFGCSESGDPFTFVMLTEGLDFKGALESLADRFGVKLETEDESPEAASRRQRRERLYALLDRAATFYERYFWEAHEAQPAREYLRERGFEEEILREFRVGYAPQSWDRLVGASAQGRLQRGRAAGGRPGPAQEGAAGRADRPVPRAARCFRRPTRAVVCAASARARWAATTGRST